MAEIQRVWPQVVGPVIAAQADPSSERDGVLGVTCSSAVWAQELDLMGPELVGRLNAALGAESVSTLRCSAAPAKRRLS
jgi:predicted nucleic acid-binding Zn ribbon protein